MRSPFFVAGAPKSGTSTLAWLLQQHPGIHIPPAKELFFFDHRYERGLGWYADQFNAAAPEQLLGDCTPWYMSSPKAARRIAALYPQARLVFILRDPASRTWSHFWHDYSSLKLDLNERPLTHLMQKEDPRRIRSCSYYGHQLARWLEYFDPSQVLLLSTHWLQRDPAALCGAVATFLGLDPTPRWASLDAAMRRMGRHSPRPGRVRWLATLQRRLGDQGFRPVQALLNRHPKLHRRFFTPTSMVLDETSRSTIEALYADDQQLLQQIAGVDVIHSEGPVWLGRGVDGR